MKNNTPVALNIEYEQVFKKLKFELPDYAQGFHTERAKLVDLFGWAIPNNKALDVIVNFSKNTPVIDYGCGLGYWSSLLRKKGLEVWPYDPHGDEGEYLEVESYIPWLDLEGPTNLLLSWPLYNDSMGVDALKEWTRKSTPQYLFYVGEDIGGCTGDENMFDYIAAYSQPVEIVDIPVWPGLHDTLTIHTFRG